MEQASGQAHGELGGSARVAPGQGKEAEGERWPLDGRGRGVCVPGERRAALLQRWMGESQRGEAAVCGSSSLGNWVSNTAVSLCVCVCSLLTILISFDRLELLSFLLIGC